jgi:hypothetical protein
VYKCSRLTDPTREPADGKILISFVADVELISDLITSLSYVVLTADEVFRLVSYMFDKSTMTNRPSSVPTPYCSENTPPEVGIFILFNNTFFRY